MNRRELMKLTGAVGAGLAMPVVWTSSGRAAETVLKWGHALPTSHPIHARATEAAARILEETKGQVQIQLFPASQLGGDTQMLSQVRSGALELFSTSGTLLGSLVANSAISGVGFAFTDYDTVWRAMDGELGAFIRAAVKPANLHLFEKIANNGFRQLTSGTKPILEAGDLAGFKVRVPQIALYTSLWEKLGASPVAMNFNELYSALQTGLVDGQENPLVLFQTAKLYEVQSSVSLTNHVWDGLWIMANLPAWERIPADLQAIVSSALNDAAVAQRQDIAASGSAIEADLAARKITFNNPDIQSFRDQLKRSGFYAEWQEKLGREAWSVLEKYSGTLS